MLEGNLDIDAILHALAVNDIRVKRRLSLVQVLNKLTDSALIMKRPLLRRILALIRERNTKSLCQECNLPKSLLERVKIKDCCLEDLLVRKKSNLRSSLVRLALAHNLQAADSSSPLVPLVIDLAFMADLHLEIRGKRIHNGCSDTVETAGYLVSAATELPAGMKHREDNLHSRLAGLRIDPDRDAASVIRHRDRIIRMDDDADMRTVAGKRLIDRIVHNLIDKVMQASRRSRTNVHPRPLSDCLKSFQDLDLVRPVLTGHFRIFCSHSILRTYETCPSETGRQ